MKKVLKENNINLYEDFKSVREEEKSKTIEKSAHVVSHFE